MPRAVLTTVAVAVLVVAAAASVVSVLVVRHDEPGPPLGAVLDADDRLALGAVPLRRGADPPPADPAVDLSDPTAVARAYLAAARSSTAGDHGRTRREASPYAAPGSPAAVGVVVLDPPEPGRPRTATVTALDLTAAADDDRRRGYRATVTTSTGPPGGGATTAVTTEYVVLARQPDGRWLVVADAPELLEGGD
jgi:hypothetical protein